MRVLLSPAGDFADLTNEISAKAASLTAAAHDGARFLALTVEDTRDAATWILAAFHSPVTVVPLPPALPVPVLEARLAQLPNGTVVFPGTLVKHRPDPQALNLRPLSEIWAVIFTSGSSGEPKGIALSGSALSESAAAHAQHNEAKNACWLLDLPLYHVGGLSVIARSLFLGLPVALGESRFDSLLTAEWIQSGKIQGLSLVPTTLYRLLADVSVDFSSLRLILLGGAPVDSDLLTRANEKKIPIRQTYGMTELASQIATERESGGGLLPLPGVELRVSGEGEILVRAPFLASGIFCTGELIPLPCVNDFFPTGDLGELVGGRLVITGRRSDLIVTGGLKVFPLELERLLTGLPGLSDCAVSSLPDAEWGEVLCAAVVETSPGSFHYDQAQTFLSDRIEKRKIPRRWISLASIPRSATGKILRSKLRELVQSAPVSPIRN